jgi:photosystem II stability/assembly factor-like uncharacterized protein
MNVFFRRVVITALSGAATLTFGLANADAPANESVPVLQIRAAESARAATHVQVLGATRAGSRIVAVGDHGVVLLSDDHGRAFRQAQSVPVNVTLTAVSFADRNTGWAVGHWGAILKTTDGGEHWVLQRSDLKSDQPLFSVYFKNAEEGWAVGLWSMVLHTTDGGRSWATIKLPHAENSKIDRNFYSIFSDRNGNLFIACEQGRVERSSDGGATWTSIDTGYAGSFWTGAALHDGALLVGGLRGTIYRSADGGNTWQAAKTSYRSSVTGIVENPDHSITAIALDGVTFTSRDDGVTFVGSQRTDRAGLMAVVGNPDGQQSLFSENGPLAPTP